MDNTFTLENDMIRSNQFKERFQYYLNNLKQK